MVSTVSVPFFTFTVTDVTSSGQVATAVPLSSCHVFFTLTFSVSGLTVTVLEVSSYLESLPPTPIV